MSAIGISIIPKHTTNFSKVINIAKSNRSSMRDKTTNTNEYKICFNNSLTLSSPPFNYTLIIHKMSD